MMRYANEVVEYINRYMQIIDAYEGEHIPVLREMLRAHPELVDNVNVVRAAIAFDRYLPSKYPGLCETLLTTSTVFDVALRLEEEASGIGRDKHTIPEILAQRVPDATRLANFLMRKTGVRHNERRRDAPRMDINGRMLSSAHPTKRMKRTDSYEDVLKQRTEPVKRIDGMLVASLSELMDMFFEGEEDAVQFIDLAHVGDAGYTWDNIRFMEQEFEPFLHVCEQMSVDYGGNGNHPNANHPMFASYLIVLFFITRNVLTSQHMGVTGQRRAESVLEENKEVIRRYLDTYKRIDKAHEKRYTKIQENLVTFLGKRKKKLIR